MGLVTPQRIRGALEVTDLKSRISWRRRPGGRVARFARVAGYELLEPETRNS